MLHPVSPSCNLSQNYGIISKPEINIGIIGYVLYSDFISFYMQALVYVCVNMRIVILCSFITCQNSYTMKIQNINTKKLPRATQDSFRIYNCNTIVTYPVFY